MNIIIKILAACFRYFWTELKEIKFVKVFLKLSS